MIIPYEILKAFCTDCFEAYGFSHPDALRIGDVLLTADLFGIESHGIQRLARYHDEIRRGMVVIDAQPTVVHETPVSAVIDGCQAMGQLVGCYAMNLAIEKARRTGIGLVAVRNSNHYGIAGYYTRMACEQDLIGVSMTNTEAIMVPTFGRRAMLGTDPIAVAMPADPVPFLFDAATTVVPRGKLEVMRKKGQPLPLGWALDASGQVSADASAVLEQIIGQLGGGILPLGGAGETLGGHKGYGLALICELFTGVLAGGPTANHLSSVAARADLSHSFWAIDYGLFGDKAAIHNRFSAYLEELRHSDKAEGYNRIYTHGEKEMENQKARLRDGIPVLDKTWQELARIASELGLNDAGLFARH